MIDPSNSEHIRHCHILKQKWTKSRSSYSVASKMFEASGQGDADTFPLFTKGDDVLCYKHCVFHDHSSLDFRLQMTSSGSQMRSKLDAERSSVNNERNTNQSGRKRVRDETTDALAAALTSLESTRGSERTIVIQDSAPTNATKENQVVELDRSMKIAKKVSI